MEKLVGVLDYGPQQMADAFRTVRKNTLIIAEDIGEEQYDFSPAAGTRTVAQLLTHIALVSTLAHRIHGIDHLDTLDGFDFPTFFGAMMADEKAPRSKAQIVELLRDNGEKFAGWLEGISPDLLNERVAMPAASGQPPKTRFEMILGIKEHEMHHRGQLMMIERMVGIVPHLTRAMLARMSAAQASQQATA